jgi:uncharacterized protein
MFARPLIDAMEFAGNGKKICGEIPLKELSRLDDMLLDSAGKLAYEVQGACTKGRNVLQVSLKGVVHLRCQRCLGELKYPVEFTSRLKLASSEELDAVDDEDEDEYIEASSQLDVIGLVEDELLLSLPFAPRHSDGECSSVSEGLKQSANPFAVLAGLKK